MLDYIYTLKNPEKEYRPHPFWSWNYKLDPEEVRRQVHIMKKAGLGGYFMHARGGLITEYLSNEWFDAIRAGVDQGKWRIWKPGAMTRKAGPAALPAVL